VNILATLLRLHTPGPVRERVLDELFAATAAGFGCDVPPMTGLSGNARLAAYARFTREQADRAVREERDLDVVQARLRREAFALGDRMRGLLGVEGVAETMAAARTLYRMIDIDLSATPEGDVTIRRCFFSDYYTPDTCRLISALDEGILAGLAGGGQFEFSQRITEGHGTCRALFTREERP
jgi:hypothetical protein